MLPLQAGHQQQQPAAPPSPPPEYCQQESSLSTNLISAGNLSGPVHVRLGLDNYGHKGQPVRVETFQQVQQPHHDRNELYMMLVISCMAFLVVLAVSRLTADILDILYESERPWSLDAWVEERLNRSSAQ